MEPSTAALTLNLPHNGLGGDTAKLGKPDLRFIENASSGCGVVEIHSGYRHAELGWEADID